MIRRSRRSGRNGQSLVELALVALVLYLTLAATIEFGRALAATQTIQDCSRLAARELALTPLGPADDFDVAIAVVSTTVYSPARLVVELDQDRYDADPLQPLVQPDGVTDGEQLDALLRRFPLVNQQLRALMVFEEVDVGAGPVRLLRYPGALIQVDPAAYFFADCPSGLTVEVPLVDYSGGLETITWLEVVEPAAAFPLDTANPATSGLAGVRINYPFQAATLSAHRSSTDDGNRHLAIVADDAAVVVGGAPAYGVPAVLADAREGATFGGTYGLGQQQALARVVRPFRKVLTAQAVFRREVFQ